MKEDKKKKGNQILFLLLVPVGSIILLVIFNYGQEIYYKNKIKSDVKDVITETFQKSGLNTLNEYKETAKRTYAEKGYNRDDISLVEVSENKYEIIGYGTYRGIFNQIKKLFVDLKNDTRTDGQDNYSASSLISASYIAYYNENKELVIEEFVDEISDDDLIEE